MFLFVNPINESGFCGCEENGTCLTALWCGIVFQELGLAT